MPIAAGEVVVEVPDEAVLMAENCGISEQLEGGRIEDYRCTGVPRCTGTEVPDLNMYRLCLYRVECPLEMQPGIC